MMSEMGGKSSVRRGQIGYADLLAVLGGVSKAVAGDPQRRSDAYSALAQALGCTQIPVVTTNSMELPDERRSKTDLKTETQPDSQDDSLQRRSSRPKKCDAVRFLVPESADRHASPPVDSQVQQTTVPQWRRRPDPPEYIPAAPMALMQSQLRRLVAQPLPGQNLDEREAVKMVAECQPIVSWPRRRRRRWGSGLWLIMDTSKRLQPLEQDSLNLIRLLEQHFPAGGVESWFGPAPTDLRRMWKKLPQNFRLQDTEWRWPPPGTRVLILSDLGLLSANPHIQSSIQNSWIEFGERLKAGGCVPLAVLPSGKTSHDAVMGRLFPSAAWGPEGGGHLQMQQLRSVACRLASLVSFAVRVEPQWLRACRLLLAGASDPAIEVLAWQSELFSGRSPIAATPATGELQQSYLGMFEAESVDLRRAVVKCWRSIRAQTAQEIFFEEYTRLAPDSVSECPPEDHEDVLNALRFMVQYYAGEEGQNAEHRLQYWIRAVNRQLGASGISASFGDIFTQLRTAIRGDGQGPIETTAHRLDISVAGKQLCIQASVAGQAEPRLQRGHSFIGSLYSRSSVVQFKRIGPVVKANGNQLSDSTAVWLDTHRRDFWTWNELADYELRTDVDTLTIRVKTRPVWASNFARDAYGLFADSVLSGVRTRWRWIPPGSFRMGSPEGEAGRFSGEGPQHWVTLTKGFWMMDVPCTQELWQAVMQGKNPRYFKDDQRPVENVSWKDAQKFIQKLNKLAPGPELRLPTEAQWEYACRAGSETALYRIPGTTGELTILGALHGPELDAIAWYGGNIGVDPKFPNAADSKSWSQKQYDHSHAATQPVRLKKANMWGLYDMLGNIWEWCADSQRPYNSEPQVDPVGQSVGSRAIRGGSWGSHARNVRCAYRNQDPPGRQRSTLGFRLVRVQEGS